MSDTPDLPRDFGARVRAGRGYLGLSQDEFGELLDRPGMSASTVKAWERGRLPPVMSRRAIVERISEVTGLPASFFYGQDERGTIGAQLRTIEAQLREAALDRQIRDVERQSRITSEVADIRRAIDDRAARLDADLHALAERLERLLDEREAARERLTDFAPEDVEDAAEFLREIRALAQRLGRDVPKRGLPAGRARDRLERRAAGDS